MAFKSVKPDSRVGNALVAPGMAFIVLLIFGPLLVSLVLSTTTFDLSSPRTSFVGLGNYIDLIVREGGAAGTFRASLVHSLTFSVVSVSIEFAIGFLLALLLNRSFRLSGFVRTLLVLPIMIAPTVSALQWRWILDPDNGILNVVARHLGPLSGAQAWLVQPHGAMGALVLVDVWQTTPFVLLFLLAGLQGLPRGPYEAAFVDGASSLQAFWYLTLPMLRQVILAVLLLRFMDAFRIFDIAYVLTRGGPAFATDMVSLFTYRLGLQWFAIGKAGAASAVTLLVIALCAATLIAILGLRPRSARS